MTEFGRYKVHPVAAIPPLLEGEPFDALVEDIRKNGLIHPIVLAPDKKTIVDGRNRWRGCKKAGVEPKFITLGSHYNNELELIRYIVASQKRRSMSSSQMAVWAASAKEPYEKAAAERRLQGNRKGGKSVQNSEPTKDFSGRVVQQLAEEFGVSHDTISRAIKILETSESLADEVLAGTATINEAYNEIKRQRKPDEKKPRASAETILLKTHLGKQIKYKLPTSKPTFNKTNDQVSWAAWTWNPVTGCLHGCKYCYARELANKKSYSDAYPIKFEPLFHHERLDAPANHAVPEEAKKDSRLGRVFVCSMADLYGKWVPDEWIEKVHQSCIDNPQWEYLMLTKFPRRYVDMKLPKTAWLGTTVDEQKRVRLAEEAFSQIKNVKVKWLSLEPLLAPLEFSDLSMFDWVVIGSQSATEQPEGHVPEYAPPFEWVAKLVAQAREAGCKVYLKPNLLGIVNSQSAGMDLPQEEP